jgi:hypothetical protein
MLAQMTQVQGDDMAYLSFAGASAGRSAGAASPPVRRQRHIATGRRWLASAMFTSERQRLQHPPSGTGIRWCLRHRALGGLGAVAPDDLDAVHRTAVIGIGRRRGLDRKNEGRARHLLEHDVVASSTFGRQPVDEG